MSDKRSRSSLLRCMLLHILHSLKAITTRQTKLVTVPPPKLSTRSFTIIAARRKHLYAVPRIDICFLPKPIDRALHLLGVLKCLRFSSIYIGMISAPTVGYIIHLEGFISPLGICLYVYAKSYGIYICSALCHLVHRFKTISPQW